MIPANRLWKVTKYYRDTFDGIEVISSTSTHVYAPTRRFAKWNAGLHTNAFKVTASVVRKQKGQKV